MINNKLYNRLINIAKSLCPIYKCHRCFHVAFLLKHNKIYKIGWNQIKTHPLLKLYPYYSIGIHAELNVIMKANKDDLSDYTLIVIRLNRNNKILYSKPCSACQNVMKQFNLYNCYYSDYNGHLIKL